MPTSNSEKSTESHSAHAGTNCICASAWVLSPPDYTPSESTPLSFPKLSSAPSAAFDSIEHTIDQLSASLRDLSLDIHAHPEIGFQEFRTSKVCVEFMRKLAGWKVTKGVYGLETAWEATFEHGEHGAGQTVGFNSEMDSLPGLGHACGHNLICIAGMAAALSVAQTLVKLDIAGRVVLLGTPSEENAGGKIIMIKNGAYKSMDACLMLHPAAVEGLAPMLAISEVEVEYVGANAHATLAWEGINALDAAVLAYNNISALRQQVNPSHRIHGIIQGSEDWVCNIVPATSRLTFGCRAPTIAEVEILKKRVEKCFEAAALATGCTLKRMEWIMTYKELRNSSLLSGGYKDYMENRQSTPIHAIPTFGSTDFGDVSYELPSLHPMYRIPVGPGEGNHTAGFAKAAATKEAHECTIRASKGIAASAWRILESKEFARNCWEEFEQKKLK